MGNENNKKFGIYRKQIYDSINVANGNLSKLKNSKLLSKEEKEKLNIVLNAIDDFKAVFNNWKNKNIPAPEFPAIYKLPLHFHLREVYDSDDNFLFQFNETFNDKLKTKIISLLNSEDSEKINNLVLFINEKDETEILAKFNKYSNPSLTLENKLFITIRGWGQLTSPHVHNLSNENAIKVQICLRDWIIYKLNNI